MAFVHVRINTTGILLIWTSFVRIGTWPDGQNPQNLSRLANGLKGYNPGSSVTSVYKDEHEVRGLVIYRRET